MTVTDANSYNPREEVQVSVSFRIEEPLHVSLVEHQRLLEIRCFHRRNVLLMNLQGTAVGKGLQVDKLKLVFLFLGSAGSRTDQ